MLMTPMREAMLMTPMREVAGPLGTELLYLCMSVLLTYR